MREDAVVNGLAAGLAGLMRRKLRFLLFIAVLFVGLIWYSYGVSWTAALFSLLALLMMGAAWITFSFWISFFSQFGRQGDRR